MQFHVAAADGEVRQRLDADVLLTGQDVLQSGRIGTDEFQHGPALGQIKQAVARGEVEELALPFDHTVAVGTAVILVDLRKVERSGHGSRR